MDTKPDDRSADAIGDSGVVVVPVTKGAPPSDGNGEPAITYEADGLWQSGAKALSRSWEEARIGWMRLTSWSRGKEEQPPSPPKGKAD